ncbi:hypothetical protein SLA2020_091370 [Shorea laevis]
MDATPSPNMAAQLSSPTQHRVNNPSALPPIPPPAPSNYFVKPKSKSSKRKTKSLGPVPKESKTVAQKPYDLPQGLKKQLDSSPLVSSVKPAVVQPRDVVLQTLPSIQKPSTCPPAATSIASVPHPNLLLEPKQAHDLGTNSQLPQVGHTFSLVATQEPVALPPTISK